MAEKSGVIKNITSAIARVFSGSKPGEFQTRVDIDQALSAIKSKAAPHPIIEPTVISDKGLESGLLYSKESIGSGNFHRYLERETTRQNRYALYERMDNSLIASALDVYANEATQKDPSDNTVVKVYSSSAYIQDELNDMLKTVGINNYASWQVIRDMCKYGDSFYALKLDSEEGVVGIKKLDQASVFRVEEDGQLIGYIQDHSVIKAVRSDSATSNNSVNPYININNLSAPYLFNRSSEEDERNERIDKFLKYELCHFRLRGSGSFHPYGISVLESCSDVWKKLDLLLDSIIIYRLNRAPSRLVFYVDVGNNQGVNAEEIIKRQINAINKKEFFDPSGKINERYNLLDMNANIYIPKGKNSESRVDLLAGASNLGDIEDVSFLNNLMFSSLKVPKSFLGYEGDVNSKGTLAQQNVTFGKSIGNIQEDFLESVKDICIIHLAIKGISSVDELKSFDLVMTRPSYIEEKARLEVEGEKLQMIGTITGLGVAKRWAFKNIMSKSDAEITSMFTKGPEDAMPAEPGTGGGMPMGGGMGDLGGGAPPPDAGGAEMPPPEAGAPGPEAAAAPMPAEAAPAAAPMQQNRFYVGDALFEGVRVPTTLSARNISKAINNTNQILLEYFKKKLDNSSDSTDQSSAEVIIEQKTLTSPDDILNNE